MYLTDYMFSDLYKKLVVEQQSQQPTQQYDTSPVDPIQHPEMASDQDQFQPDQGFNGMGSPLADGSNGAVEFENIKRYILYGKLKDLKHKLEISDIDHNSPEVKNIMEFIDLITTFYNTFTYEDTVKLFDSLVDSVSIELKIKLPSRVDNLEDETPEETMPVNNQQISEPHI